MSIWEVLLIGAALAMDAAAVGMTDGMTEPQMPLGKAAGIAMTFALFQFLMPVIGYYCGYAFSAAVAVVAPWLSFALLSFLGGKTIAESVLELRGAKRAIAPPRAAKPLGVCKLMTQGVATSLDALAVGVTLLAAETRAPLPVHAVWCAAIVGAVTFVLALGAVCLGKRVGDRFSAWAGIAGGVVLVGIGLKILLEGVL